MTIVIALATTKQTLNVRIHASKYNFNGIRKQQAKVNPTKALKMPW